MEARKSSKVILGKENVVLLAVSGLVLGLFRGPLGSWVYGMAPLRPRLGVLIEKKFQMGISGRHHIFLPFWMRDNAEAGKRGSFGSSRARFGAV